MATEEAVSMKQDLNPQNKPKRNKFALACAILASMTSILLGYGEYYTATYIFCIPSLIFLSP